MQLQTVKINLLIATYVILQIPSASAKCDLCPLNCPAYEKLITKLPVSYFDNNPHFECRCQQLSQCAILIIHTDIKSSLVKSINKLSTAHQAWEFQL